MTGSTDRWAHSAFEQVAPHPLDSVGPLDEFPPALAYAHPGPLRGFDGEQRRKTICIVGGGIAGLAAAYELDLLDHDVTVLEASGRFGGRIFTHHFGDGTYGELGAMRLPEDHRCVLHYVDDVFALAKREFISRNEDGWCLFRDAPKMRRGEWDRSWQGFYDTTRTGDPVGRLISQLASSIALTARDLWESLSNTLTDGRLRHLDSLALVHHALGLPPPSLSAVSSPVGPPFDDELWAYAGRTSLHTWLELTSLLHWAREAHILDNAEKWELVGGMEKLVDAFVDAIMKSSPNALQSQHRVEAITLGDRGVTVQWNAEASGRTSREFDYVLCTASAPATMRIDFASALTPAKREALSSLTYMSAGKTLMHCSERHWEIHDRIYGGSSVTDRPNQQCWYPSDNALPPDPNASNHVAAVLLPSPGRDLLDQPVAISGGRVRDEELSHSPGVFLAAYLWGKNSQRFASLNKGERDDLIGDSVAQLHDHNASTVDEIVHFSWDEQSDPGGGAFAWFGPGEQRRYQAALCAPLPEREPRVFFAGEHVGVLHGWIQSAIQSSLQAAIEILRAP